MRNLLLLFIAALSQRSMLAQCTGRADVRNIEPVSLEGSGAYDATSRLTRFNVSFLLYRSCPDNRMATIYYEYDVRLKRGFLSPQEAKVLTEPKYVNVSFDKDGQNPILVKDRFYLGNLYEQEVTNLHVTKVIFSANPPITIKLTEEQVVALRRKNEPPKTSNNAITITVPSKSSPPATVATSKTPITISLPPPSKSSPPATVVACDVNDIKATFKSAEAVGPAYAPPGYYSEAYSWRYTYSIWRGCTTQPVKFGLKVFIDWLPGIYSRGGIVQGGSVHVIDKNEPNPSLVSTLEDGSRPRSVDPRFGADVRSVRIEQIVFCHTIVDDTANEQGATFPWTKFWRENLCN